MNVRLASFGDHPFRRSAASVAVGAGALIALCVLSSVFGAAHLSRLMEDTLVRLDQQVAEVHADLRTRVGSRDSIAEEVKSTDAQVRRILDFLRGVGASSVPVTPATVVQSTIARFSARLAADPDVDAIARAYSAYATEAARTVQTPLTEDTADTGRMFELRYLGLKQAIADVRDVCARRAVRLLALVDVAARLLISLGAMTFVYFLWRRAAMRGDRGAAAGVALPRVSQPVALIDGHGVIQRVEGAADQVFGREKDSLLGTNISALVHSGDETAVQRFVALCSKDPKAVAAVEFRPKHLDRVWFSMESVSGRRKGDPTATGLVVRFVDVTSRKIAEQALRRSTELVQTLIESSPLAIVIEDERGHVRLWNTAAERMFGWTADQVLGRANPTIPGDAVEEHRNLRIRVLAGHAFTGLESKRAQKDGTTLDVSITTAPLKRSDGGSADIMDVIADITDRKELEAQLRQAQKMEGIGRLAGGIAHDFNNLLTAINGHAELLLQSPALANPTGADANRQNDSTIRREIEQILRAGERAAALTQQLLAFSRSQVLQPTILNLSAAVTDMEQMLRRLIGEDIDLAFIPGANLESIKADPTQIAQVIMNLALNARDAMPTGGKLTIETTNVELDELYTRKHVPVVPGPYVMLAVSDTGLGMDKETQARVFEPFFTTKEKGKGTGLGLATVYGIVRQSGGYIWVYSEPGHGTSFKVYLPSAERRSGIEEVVNRPSRPPADGSETVLLVEDEEMVRTLVRQVLTWYGYNVIDAHNGEEALKVASGYAGTIDLMLTDIVMPGMSALDLVERLSSLRPTTKVLYMSGYTDHAVVRNNLLSANRAFLQKPFAPDRLAHKIREVLSQNDGGHHPQHSSSETEHDHARVLPFVS